MRRFFKWLAIGFGGLLGLILLVAVVLLFIGDARLKRTYDISVVGVPVPTDPAGIARGKHRVETACTDCHGPDLGGILGWFNAPSFGKIDTANLTTGVGGIGRRYASTDDYVRAIRHGVDPQGKAVFMSSVIAFQYLSDEDLGAMIAYLRAAAPVDRETGGVYLAPLSKILLASGLSAPIPAEVVDHTARRIPPVVAVSAEYGKYLLEISGCRDCHGQDLDGGPFPDPTIERIVPNITPGGELAFWSGEDFITALRTGVTPGGHAFDPKLMPWKTYRNLTDDELGAIWLYLQELPALQQRTRKD